MDSHSKSRLLRFVERAVWLARRAGARFLTRDSRKRFTLRQHVALICLEVKKTTTYRDLVVELIEMVEVAGIESGPMASRVRGCKAFDRLKMVGSGSFGITIPKKNLDERGLEAGDEVGIVTTDESGVLIIHLPPKHEK